MQTNQQNWLDRHYIILEECDGRNIRAESGDLEFFSLMKDSCQNLWKEIKDQITQYKGGSITEFVLTWATDEEIQKPGVKPNSMKLDATDMWLIHIEGDQNRKTSLRIKDIRFLSLKIDDEDLSIVVQPVCLVWTE